MPARERRSGSPRETRERDTKEEKNSLSRLITRKEVDDGGKRDKSKKGAKADKGRKEEGEGFKTTSVLNTHPVSPGNTRPYSKDDRELM